MTNDEQDNEFSSAFDEDIGPAEPAEPMEEALPAAPEPEAMPKAQPESMPKEPTVDGDIDPAGEAGEPPGEAAIEQIAEGVESGEISAAEAVELLSEDFGDSFVQLLRVLIKADATGIADEKVGNVSRTVDEVVADIVDARQRAHFESIADACPDFLEVANGQAMQDYIASLPPEAQAAAQQTIERGKTRQVIGLLKAAKKFGGQGGADESETDAAEGVRSGGLRIPTQPKASQDYDEAWEQF